MHTCVTTATFLLKWMGGKVQSRPGKVGISELGVEGCRFIHRMKIYPHMRGIALTKCIHICLMIHTLHCGYIHREWIGSQIGDRTKYCGLITVYGLIHRSWIDPKIVDWSTYCGLIHGMWNDPWALEWSTVDGSTVPGWSIHWIDPQIVDWS